MHHPCRKTCRIAIASVATVLLLAALGYVHWRSGLQPIPAPTPPAPSPVASVQAFSSTTLPSPTSVPSPTPSPSPWISPLPEAELWVWPYLGETTPDGVSISWAAQQTGVSQVRYGLDAKLTGVVTSTENVYDGKYWHMATLGGLQAGCTYHYRIVQDGLDVTPWPDVTLHTAPAVETTHFVFAVLGDSRPAATGSASPSPGARAVADVLQSLDVAFALHTGDMLGRGGVCTGASSAWNQYVGAYLNLYRQTLGRVPLYPTLGNHDLSGGSCGYQAYRDVFALPDNAPQGQECYYSFDWASAHFIALDTNADISCGSAQYAWLEHDLQSTQQAWKFVFFHHPAYSSGEHGNTPEVHDNLVPLFEAYGVDAVFVGHDHHYERTCPILRDACSTTAAGGVVYYVTGGAGAPRYDVGSDWFTAYRDSRNHLIRVEVDGNRARLDAIGTDGQVFDNLTLERHD
jgi:hypothetical protein